MIETYAVCVECKQAYTVNAKDWSTAQLMTGTEGRCPEHSKGRVITFARYTRLELPELPDGGKR